MELKDVILSTLAEMDQSKEAPADQGPDAQHATAETVENETDQRETGHAMDSDTSQPRDITDEVKYLESIKERLLVLFEGFQSPNNVEIEAKIDLTLNFLEYLLSTIDSRLDTLKKRG